MSANRRVTLSIAALLLIDPVLSLVGTTNGTKEDAATAQSKSEGLRFRRILVSADNGVPAISRQFPTQSRRLGRVHRGEQVDGPLEIIGGTPVLTPPLVEVRSEDQGLRLPERRAELGEQRVRGLDVVDARGALA